MLGIRLRGPRSCLRKLAVRRFVPPASCVASFGAVEHRHPPPHGSQLLLPLSTCVGRRRLYVAFF
jgi:hypothetical protein